MTEIENIYPLAHVAEAHSALSATVFQMWHLLCETVNCSFNASRRIFFQKVHFESSVVLIAIIIRKCLTPQLPSHSPGVQGLPALLSCVLTWGGSCQWSIKCSFLSQTSYPVALHKHHLNKCTQKLLRPLMWAEGEDRRSNQSYLSALCDQFCWQPGCPCNSSEVDCQLAVKATLELA